jgi:hypothetical protein
VRPSIATGTDRTAARRSSARDVGARLDSALGGIDPALIGLTFVVVALIVYELSHPGRNNFYNHFVWLADAFVHGRLAISYPVSEGPFVNAYFQDVMPVPGQPGLGWVPFPPLPAVLLVPFVAAFGLATNAALFAVGLGAINVGLAWRLVTRLSTRPAVAVLATIFFAFGTVHWYAAMLGSTWFLAHVVAVTFLLLATTLAIDADARQGAIGLLSRLPIEPRQFVAGLLLGLAGTARLSVLVGAPFFVLVGGGGSWRRRAFSAGLGAAIPVALMLAYNFASTGQLFHPAYEWLYQHEYVPEPGLIHRDWLIEDPRYIPQNLVIMLGWLPLFQPECGFALFDRACPLIVPDKLGMSLLLSSPAYLLVLPALFGLREWATTADRRIIYGSALAVAAIALFNLMHFSQGWVQFGYRFSNDFAPFALVLVTLGIVRVGVRWWVLALVALSVLINAWGVYWGVVLGW